MGLPILLRQFLLRSGLLFLIKIIGAIGRIVMFRFLGAEGIGLYQMVYAFYGLILTLITAGVPTSLSLATAKDVRHGIQLLKQSAIFLCVLGGITAFVSYAYAERIGSWYGNSDLSWAIQLLSPVFLFVPLLHLFRGFLQGVEYYGVICISELIEQIARILILCVFVTIWLPYGISVAVGGATLGAVTGGFCALVFLGIYIFLYKKLLPSSFHHNADTSTFLKVSFSVLSTRLLIPLTDFIDSILIPNRLIHSGLSLHQSTVVFGEMTGMALTIIYFPSMATSALLHVLIPKIAKNWADHNFTQFDDRVKKAMRVGWLWGVCTSLYFFLYAQNVSVAVIGNSSLTYPIICLSLLPLIAGVRDISTNILWVKGVKKAPVMGLAIGAIFSILINYWLVAIPSYQYIGIAMGILTFELISLLWNLRHFKTAFSFKMFAESVIFLAISYVLAKFLDRIFYDHIYMHAVSYIGLTFVYLVLSYSRRIDNPR